MVKTTAGTSSEPTRPVSNAGYSVQPQEFFLNGIRGEDGRKGLRKCPCKPSDFLAEEVLESAAIARTR